MRLFDTGTRSLRDYAPVIPVQVSIYVCGATVQSEPHIGHVRSSVDFDILRRWLLHQGMRVIYVRNVTDIDDKILAKSAEAGEPWLAELGASRRAVRVRIAGDERWLAIEDVARYRDAVSVAVGDLRRPLATPAT